MDEELLEILGCPIDKSELVLTAGDQLVCSQCGEVYEVRDGIPVMLIDKYLPCDE